MMRQRIAGLVRAGATGVAMTALAAVIAPDAEAQIIVPEAVDPGAVVIVGLETPAPEGALLALRRFQEDGEGSVMRSWQVMPGAGQVGIEAPALGGSYVLELVVGARLRHRAMLEVAAAPVMLELPLQPDAGQLFEVRWRGGAGRGDVLEVVDAGGQQISRQALAGGDVGVAEVTAPSSSGQYEIRLRDGRTGTVLSRARFEVDATRGWLRAPSMAAPGSDVRVDWFGPDGATFAIRLVTEDDAQVVTERVLADGLAEADSLTLSAPRRAGRYRLRYLNLATGEILSDSVLIVR